MPRKKSRATITSTPKSPVFEKLEQLRHARAIDADPENFLLGADRAAVVDVAGDRSAGHVHVAVFRRLLQNVRVIKEFDYHGYCSN